MYNYFNESVIFKYILHNISELKSFKTKNNERPFLRIFIIFKQLIEIYIFIYI